MQARSYRQLELYGGRRLSRLDCDPSAPDYTTECVELNSDNEARRVRWYLLNHVSSDLVAVKYGKPVIPE